MEVDAETARWAQDVDSNVVWCNSAEAILQAVENNELDIEVGAAEAGPVVEAVCKVAVRLKSLSLTGCGLDAACLTRLGAALAPTQIWGIGVSNNPDVDLAAWAEFWDKLPASVAKYDFGDNGLPDEALPKLMATFCKGRVQELFLDGNMLTDISPLLPLVSESFGLKELDIGDNNIEDAQVLQLAQALPASLVEALTLGRNNISDAGAVPLAQVLPRTRVSVLHLDTTQIGDATLDALIGVLAGSLLEELHIDETKVTDAGVLKLARALPTSRIKYLDASDNNLSDATISAIEDALPEDTID